jgi:hypothetical protein
MKTVLKSLPHLPWMITLVEPDDMTLKGDSQVFRGEVRTVGIVPGAVLEQFLCDRLRINDDDVPSQESGIDEVS